MGPRRSVIALISIFFRRTLHALVVQRRDMRAMKHARDQSIPLPIIGAKLGRWAWPGLVSQISDL